MSFVGDVIGGIVVLVVAVWVAIFGTAGAALAAHRGQDRFNGFVVGALAGPVGCFWLYLGDRRYVALRQVARHVADGTRGPGAPPLPLRQERETRRERRLP